MVAVANVHMQCERLPALAIRQEAGLPGYPAGGWAIRMWRLSTSVEVKYKMNEMNDASPGYPQEAGLSTGDQRKG